MYRLKETGIEHRIYQQKMSSRGSSPVFQRVLAMVHILFLCICNRGAFAEIVESASSLPRETVVRHTSSLLGRGQRRLQSSPFPKETMPLLHSIKSEPALPERRELPRQHSSTSPTSARPSNITQRCENHSAAVFTVLTFRFLSLFPTWGMS